MPCFLSSDNNCIVMFNSFSPYFYVLGFYSCGSTLLNRFKPYNDNTADVIIDVFTEESLAPFSKCKPEVLLMEKP